MQQRSLAGSMPHASYEERDICVPSAWLTPDVFPGTVPAYRGCLGRTCSAGHGMMELRWPVWPTWVD